MKVSNVTLYHYHVKECDNILWHNGNNFTIDDSFNTFLYRRHKSFIDGFRFGKFRYSLYEQINNIIKKRDLTPEEISRFGNRYYLTKIINRELMIEEYRQKYYPSLPSRFHSIFLADESQLPYWNKVLGDSISLFEVNVSGTIHKTSDLYLLDNEDQSSPLLLEDCECYWNPPQEVLDSTEHVEYLFQGDVKVLKKIK